MRLSFAWASLALIALLSSCTHSIHLVNTSSFEPYAQLANGRMVEAQSEQFVIMGFVKDTNYVDQAYRNLKQQCRDGAIQGITTQYSTSHGFFSWTHKILMQGLCVQPRST